jgi:alkylated DNA nucleotide flippase Atl1
MAKTTDLIYQIIQKVPKGKVIYYGQISDVLFVKYEIFLRAQVVGWMMSAMKKNLDFQDCNWQRVVAKTGSISTFKLGLMGSAQVNLLEKEGVFLKDSLIDMKKFGLETDELLKLCSSLTPSKN